MVLLNSKSAWCEFRQNNGKDYSMSSTLNENLRQLLAVTAELVELMSCSSYSATWENRTQGQFIFLAQTPEVTRRYDYEVRVESSYYLCRGEAKVFVACTLILRILELLEGFTEEQKERDRRVKDALIEYEHLIQPILQKQGQAKHPRTVLSSFDREQRAGLIVRYLTDKSLQQRLYAQGLGIIGGKKSPTSGKARQQLAREQESVSL